MADRVQMTAPTGAGTALVAKSKVEAFEANGWRVVEARKPARRKKAADDDEK